MFSLQNGQHTRHQRHLRGGLRILIPIGGLKSESLHKTWLANAKLLKNSQKNMLKVPSTISKIVTLADNTVRLQVDCQELDSTSEADIFKLRNKLGHFVFAVDENITQEDIPTETLDFPTDKSPAQRLRAVLFRLWEQSPRGYKEFEGFYRATMEKYIESLKEKLT